MVLQRATRLATAAVLLSLCLLERTGAAQARRRYDPTYVRGRTPGTSAADNLLWVPRVLFYPVHLALEYGLRVPLLFTLGESERVGILGHQGGSPGLATFTWSPTLVADLGQATTVGAGVTWTNAPFRGNRLRLDGVFGGVTVYELWGDERVVVGPARVGVRGGYLHRDDPRFYGLGPTSSAADHTNYTLVRGDAFLFAGWSLAHHVDVELSVGYRAEDTGPSSAPSLETRFTAQGDAPGFGPLRLVMAAATLALDTRTHPAQDTALRLDARATFAQDLLASARRFVVAEGGLRGAVEIARPHRVLAASVYLANATPLSDLAVPFVELPALGGARHSGFLPGRFRGQSAVLAGLEYFYPIWEDLDAFWFGSVGNVFGTHFAGLDPRLFTASLGVGVRTRSRGDVSLEFFVALGTRRFDEPAGVDSGRVFFGLRR